MEPQNLEFMQTSVPFCTDQTEVVNANQQVDQSITQSPITDAKKPNVFDQNQRSNYLPKRPKKTIESDYIKNLQWRHALIVNWFSFLGVVIASILILSGNPVSSVEVGLFAGMWFLTEIGIIVGFHRHFTHCSFQAATPVRIVLSILGSMAAQGSLVFWVSLHRLHHEYSDKQGDPHSPHLHGESLLERLRGLWHSYIGWTLNHPVANPNHYASDLLRDQVISKVNKLYLVWVLLGLAIPTVLGGILRGSWAGAFYGFLWGGPVRMYLTHNLVWSITSIAHVFGNRPLNSKDRSTNNIWIALPTLGESWHNNHHAFPNAAIVGWKWWQIDIAGWIVRALEKLGLIWDVKVPTASMIQAKKID